MLEVKVAGAILEPDSHKQYVRQELSICMENGKKKKKSIDSEPNSKVKSPVPGIFHEAITPGHYYWIQMHFLLLTAQILVFSGGLCAAQYLWTFVSPKSREIPIKSC